MEEHVAHVDDLPPLETDDHVPVGVRGARVEEPDLLSAEEDRGGTGEGEARVDDPELLHRRDVALERGQLLLGAREVGSLRRAGRLELLSRLLEGRRQLLLDGLAGVRLGEEADAPRGVLVRHHDRVAREGLKAHRVVAVVVRQDDVADRPVRRSPDGRHDRGSLGGCRACVDDEDALVGHEVGDVAPLGAREEVETLRHGDALQACGGGLGRRGRGGQEQRDDHEQERAGERRHGTSCGAGAVRRRGRYRPAGAGASGTTNARGRGLTSARAGRGRRGPCAASVPGHRRASRGA